ncbi:hypothetical protein B0H11DRAFT_1931214 [Mycena galericulata]|nr:hypothetical protein B0H11DRAFT_1931214 [Mycena galericulata]
MSLKPDSAVHTSRSRIASTRLRDGNNSEALSAVHETLLKQTKAHVTAGLPDAGKRPLRAQGLPTGIFGLNRSSRSTLGMAESPLGEPGDSESAVRWRTENPRGLGREPQRAVDPVECSTSNEYHEYSCLSIRESRIFVFVNGCGCAIRANANISFQES